MRDAEAQLIHDMRNTAMVLREAADQLHQQGDVLSPAAVAHLTAMLARRSDMLVQLLGDLTTSHLAGRSDLDLSLQEVSLPAICSDVVAGRHPSVGRRIRVDVGEDALVVADPLRLTQVLDNLITNALRYGGPEVWVRARREGSTVRLTVSDDGPGVPTGLVGTLFDAYVHGSASHELGGSGLGLRIVRQLCEAMSGTIEYDGSDGASFTARFPALPFAAAPLGDDAAGAGHSVVFWDSEDALTQSLVPFLAHGLIRGEAVVVAATAAHHALLEEGLAALGIDASASIASGQYLPLDADRLKQELPRHGRIESARFDALVGDAVREVSRRWRSMRFFGEVVDLFWRSQEDDLALELESCWNRLLADLPFPLLCAYELTAGEPAPTLCGCHDRVVPARPPAA